MDGKCFLTTAQFLSTEGSTEADFRSAVSRAYYACFLTARGIAFRNCGEAFRQSADIHKESSITHDRLPRYLKAGSGEAVQRLGVTLAGLLGCRKDADYEMAGQFEKGDAVQSIDDAEAFLAAIAEARPQDIGKAMENNIRLTCRT